MLLFWSSRRLAVLITLTFSALTRPCGPCSHYQSAWSTVYLRCVVVVLTAARLSPEPAGRFHFPSVPVLGHGGPPLPTLDNYLLSPWNLLRLDLYAANYYAICCPQYVDNSLLNCWNLFAWNILPTIYEHKHLLILYIIWQRLLVFSLSFGLIFLSLETLLMYPSCWCLLLCQLFYIVQHLISFTVWFVNVNTIFYHTFLEILMEILQL